MDKIKDKPTPASRAVVYNGDISDEDSDNSDIGPLLEEQTSPLPRPESPKIVPPSPSDSEREETSVQNDTTDAGETLDPPLRPRTVRFYSRVRITSGVGHSTKSHHKHSSTRSTDASGGRPSRIRRPPSTGHSGDSSASGSYSSSISAPLRSSTELPPRMQSVRQSSKQRKALSEVLDTRDTASWLHALAVERRDRRDSKIRRSNDERTALLSQPSGRRSITPVEDQEQEEALLAADVRKTEADVLFGKWPWRLFSLYVSCKLFRDGVLLTTHSVLGVTACSTVLL